MKGKGHTPILLDEFNWWPLAYPLKCKWLIARDALLTGASKPQLNVCATPTTPDPAHFKRFLSYQWIENSEASELNHLKRHAKILNRSLKNGLMDWGFADAVMALGSMEDVLSAGIRELLIKSLQSPFKDVSTPPAKVDGEVFFVTHSLGSYLSLIALDYGIARLRQSGPLRFPNDPRTEGGSRLFFGPHGGILFSGKSDCITATGVGIQFDRACCWPLPISQWGKICPRINRALALRTRHLLDGARFRCAYAADYCLA